jgi:phosphoglycolate phosphatase
MRYEAVIFDLDGTLWDSNESCVKGWNSVLVKLNYKDRITKKGMNTITGKTVSECIDILLPGIKDQYEDITELITNSEKDGIEKYGASIYPDVIDNIIGLSGHFKIYIVSNCQESYLLKFIEYSGLAPVLSGWDCYGSSKIEKHLMISNIKKTNNIERAVYIGDTEFDKESAELSGSDFIQLTYGFGAPIKDVTNFNNFNALCLYLLQ